MLEPTCQRGFTLIEMVMAIIILGIIGAMVGVFMKKPIDAYIDSGRRAALTDVADTAVRRIARDVRRALPNSVRLPTDGVSTSCIEFIPTKTGGRYRAVLDPTVGGTQTANVLDFTAPDASFNMLGDNDDPALPPDQKIAVNDLVAVFNLDIPGADAYTLGNVATINAPPTVTPSRVVGTITYGAETSIVTTMPAAAYLASPNNRFHVIPSSEPAVSYVCSAAALLGGEGQGTLYRWVHPIGANTLTCPGVPPGTPALAKKVSSCRFEYNNDVLKREGLLRVKLEVATGDETVSLYHEVHVDLSP